MHKKIVAILCIILCLGVVFMPQTFAQVSYIRDLERVVEDCKATNTGTLMMDGREVLGNPPGFIYGCS